MTCCSLKSYVVVLAEDREEILGLVGRTAHADIAFIRRLRIAEQLLLIVLRPPIAGIDDGLGNAGLGAPSLRAGEGGERPDGQGVRVTEMPELRRDLPLWLAGGAAFRRDDDDAGGGL